MLFQIGSGNRSTDERDATVGERLLACHERIRRFTALAERLGQHGDEPSAQVRDAAGAVLRYFTEALPLHSQDEDESILPRMRHVPELSGPLESMRAQHEDIHRALEDIEPAWRRLVDEPGARAELRPRLAEGARRLRALFDEHLGLEEEHILPALDRHLSVAAQQEIVAEMVARRE